MTSFLSRGGVGAAKTDTAELELGGKRRREREREEGRKEGSKEGRAGGGGERGQGEQLG